MMILPMIDQLGNAIGSLILDFEEGLTWSRGFQARSASRR